METQQTIVFRRTLAGEMHVQSFNDVLQQNEFEDARDSQSDTDDDEEDEDDVNTDTDANTSTEATETVTNDLRVAAGGFGR